MDTTQIDILDKLPEILKQPPTLLEIGGYSHYENVISNYLAYYFDPAQSHGLGDVMLRAWIKPLGIAGKFDFSTVQVDREVATTEGKRIDLLIQTPEVIFCIEHKIFHHAKGNPLKEYQSFVEEHFPEQRYYFSLLSLDTIDEDLLEGSAFQNILYADFIEPLEALLPTTEPAPFSLLFLKELLQTIKNLTQKQAMQQETLQLIRDNLSDFQKLSSHLIDIQKDMDEKLLAVKGEIKNSELPIQNPQTWLSSNEAARKGIKAVLFYRLKDHSNMELKIRLTPKGWTTELWNAPTHLTERLNLSEHLNYISEEGNKYFQLQDQENPDDYDSTPSFIKEQVSQLLAKAGIIK